VTGTSPDALGAALQHAGEAALAARLASARRDAAIAAALAAGASLRAVGAVVGLSKRGVWLAAQRVESLAEAPSEASPPSEAVESLAPQSLEPRSPREPGGSREPGRSRTRREPGEPDGSEASTSPNP
jgi:hypothetical protein